MKARILEGKFTMTGKVWDEISDDAKDLVSKLLTYEKEKRCSAEEALSHKWITNM
jgi:serine/threonine protein kinase